MSRLVVVSSAEAVPTDQQHTKPCSDCPWRRDSVQRWLGGLSPQDWLEYAHGEDKIDCHTLRGPQCAGAAIYRSNVCKSPRNKSLLVLPPNKVAVFSNPREFEAHHQAPRDPNA